MGNTAFSVKGCVDNFKDEYFEKVLEGVKDEMFQQELRNNIETSKEKNKPSVACIEWIDPLMMAGNWIPEMVEIAGGINILSKPGKDSHWVKFHEISPNRVSDNFEGAGSLLCR